MFKKKSKKRKWNAVDSLTWFIFIGLSVSAFTSLIVVATLVITG